MSDNNKAVEPTSQGDFAGASDGGVSERDAILAEMKSKSVHSPHPILSGPEEI